MLLVQLLRLHPSSWVKKQMLDLHVLGRKLSGWKHAAYMVLGARLRGEELWTPGSWI